MTNPMTHHGSAGRWSRLAAAWRVDGSLEARKERTRFIAVLFFTAVGVGGLAFLAIPGWEIDRASVLLTLAVAAGSALGLLLVYRRFPPEIIHVVVAGGSVTIARVQAVVDSPGAGIAVGALYVWVAVFAGLYFRLGVALTHVAIAIAAEATALVAAADPAIGPQLILTAGTCIAAAVVVAVPANRLRRSATVDPLTGIANRAAAIGIIEAALARARRRDDVCALLAVDLDRFKQVNDTYGHTAGDTVLKTVAARMRDAVRGGGHVARLGGDEFIVVLEDLADRRDAEEAALRLIRAVSAPVPVGKADAEVGASIGIALSHGAGTGVDAMLSDADAAAYEAKTQGRGRHVVFDRHLRDTLHVRRRAENDLMRALAGGRLALRFQPATDPRTGAVDSLVATPWWRHPAYGLIPAADLLQAAPSDRVRCELDSWTLRAAVAQIAAWDKADGRSDVVVGVAVSRAYLTAGSIAADAAAALAAEGVTADRLAIEVSEAAVTADPRAAHAVTRLHDLGVRFVVTDFGAAVDVIRGLPIDSLTIRCGRGGHLAEPGSDRSADALARLARSALRDGGRLIADGVADESAARTATRAGIGLARGPWIAPPSSADEILDLIRQSPTGRLPPHPESRIP